MIDFIRNHRTGTTIGAAAGLALVAFLAFGVFGVQFLFIDSKVDEANPFADATQVSADAADSDGADSDGTDADQADSTESAEADEPAVATDTSTVIETVVAGDFVGDVHPTSGTASVITDGNQRFLRFENFESDNGPDLNVYLRADNGDFIDLGDLKGNIGAQNYEVPADVDLSVYNTVQIWCVRFGVNFGDAHLTA